MVNESKGNDLCEIIKIEMLNRSQPYGGCRIAASSFIFYFIFNGFDSKIRYICLNLTESE